MHSLDAHTALVLPPDTDLSLFSALLRQHGVDHRISVKTDQLVLDVFDATQVAPVQQLYQGLVRSELQQQPKTFWQAINPIRLWRQSLSTPVTSLLVLFSILGFLLVEFDTEHLSWRWFTFQGYERQFDGLRVVGWAPEPLALAMERGEFWRLLTPAFLHFNLLHIFFNVIGTWELGRRLELRLGGWHLFFLFNTLAVGSNLVQYASSTHSLFGGISGVIFGFLGYCWVWDKLLPSAEYALPKGAAGFAIGWLVFCYSGLTEIFGIRVANEAHVAGLVLGLVFGAASALLARRHPHSIFPGNE